MKINIKNWIPEILWAGAAVLLSLVLKEDASSFWKWWLVVEVLGLTAMPLTGRLFRCFDDKGWMFSKVAGIALTGFLTWYLVSIKVMKFTALSCILVCLVCLVGAVLWGQIGRYGIRFYERKEVGAGNRSWLPLEHKKLIFWEEIIFLLMFLLWTYFAGFNAQAYGTEKFMDYGFMEAMMRSTVLPARDIWYSEGHINYYYGGQYFAVFLTKISGTEVKITYNLMRTFVAGLAFVLPFSLAYQMTKDRFAHKLTGRTRAVPAIAGLTAGAAVSIAGNMHYVVYCLGKNLLEWIQGVPVGERSSYWFPDATRYIGFDPDVADKTIHEFPCYSFVLGDLHAHVVNIMFVLLVLGLLYAFMKQRRSEGPDRSEGKAFYLRQFCAPQILAVSLLLGMFQWTNYWDFVIYYVVCAGVVLFTNIICLEGKIKKILAVTLLQAVEIFVLAYMVILPFTLQFDSMVDGVALAQNHSLPHQLLILWGLPTILTVFFVAALLWEKLFKKKQKNLYTLMESISIPDLFAVVTGLCAIGLVIIPELVYVRDIYENGNARANTMFKLTYQAYIMFGITMGYVIYRMLLISKQKVFKAVSVLGAFCLLLTCGYFGKSVSSWFGEVTDLSQYEGLDATAYMEYTFYEDVGGINWLKENVTDVQVVLEANGDSYTDFERVSAMTGLPTVLGWYVHEWLWRNDTDDLNRKSADVETIYTSQDTAAVERLLADYDVSYIFVGAREQEKYGESLNNDLLRSLGEVVYEDEVYDTYIVEVY